MNPRKVIKTLIPKKAFKAIEPYGHLGESVLFNGLNGFPGKGLKVIGVTGTNGKTTTAFLIHKMLHEADFKVGLMTTVAYGVGEDIKPQTQHMTTVPAPVLLKRIKQMKSEGVEWLVLETTSHALAQYRVWGIPYSVAVLTNITHEHLDYHGTFEKYRQAKLKLFKLVARNRNGLGVGVINADDPSVELFSSSVPKALTYGIDAGQLRAKKIKASPTGSQFEAVGEGGEALNIKLNLPGKFNIYNALAAVGVGLALGLEPKQIEQGIAALTGVAGRMETIEAGQDFSVVVDYAITPDALENSLQTLKTATKGRIFIVFGATGDRDKSKRPAMGEVAAKNADKVFLTDDETYTEDPKTIRDAVYEGIAKAGGEKKTTVIGDRREAIKAAFTEAKAGDTVLLTGIGHQTTRNMGGKEEPWDDRDTAKEILQKP